MFPTVYRRACPPKSRVLPVNLRAWSKRKTAWPKKFFGASSAGGPLLLPTLGPGPALDGPAAKPSAFWSRRFRRPSKPAKPVAFGIRKSIKHEFEVYRVCRFQNWYQSNTPKMADFLSVKRKNAHKNIPDSGSFIEQPKRLLFVLVGGIIIIHYFIPCIAFWHLNEFARWPASQLVKKKNFCKFSKKQGKPISRRRMWFLKSSKSIYLNDNSCLLLQQLPI